MLNREQRRAQLKQLGKKFTGLDVTTGVLTIPNKNGNEDIEIDMMNFDTIYYLSEMADKFTNIQENYKEDFESVDSIENPTKKAVAITRIYKKVIDDFVFYIDKIFGDGATKKIFGNTAPMPQAIGEFLEDLTPVLKSVMLIMQEESATNTQSSNISSMYSGNRVGNV